MRVPRICTSSPPSDARMEAPMMRSLEASTTSFMSPAVSPRSMARATRVIGHGPIFGREILPFHQIAVNDLEIVVGDVRESRATLAIAEGPNARNVRLEAAVHFDRATLVPFDAGFIQAEIVRIRSASRGDQEMRAGDAGWACSSVERKSDSAVLVFDARSAGVEQELYSLGFERRLQLGSNFRIFARNNLLAGMQNGDAAAVAAEHLPKFQADVAGSKNQEVFGDICELHDGFVGEIRDGIQ